MPVNVADLEVTINAIGAAETANDLGSVEAAGQGAASGLNAFGKGAGDVSRTLLPVSVNLRLVERAFLRMGIEAGKVNPTFGTLLIGLARTHPLLLVAALGIAALAIAHHFLQSETEKSTAAIDKMAEALKEQEKSNISSPKNINNTEDRLKGLKEELATLIELQNKDKALLENKRKLSDLSDKELANVTEIPFRQERKLKLEEKIAAIQELLNKGLEIESNELRGIANLEEARADAELAHKISILLLGAQRNTLTKQQVEQAKDLVTFAQAELDFAKARGLVGLDLKRFEDALIAAKLVGQTIEEKALERSQAKRALTARERTADIEHLDFLKASGQLTEDDITKAKTILLQIENRIAAIRRLQAEQNKPSPTVRNPNLTGLLVVIADNDEINQLLKEQAKLRLSLLNIPITTEEQKAQVESELESLRLTRQLIGLNDQDNQKLLNIIHTLGQQSEAIQTAIGGTEALNKLEAKRQALLTEIATITFGGGNAAALKAQLSALDALIAKARELLLINPTQLGQDLQKVLEQLQKGLGVLGIQLSIQPPSQTAVDDAIGELEKHIKDSKAKRQIELQIPFKLKLEAFTEDFQEELRKRIERHKLETNIPVEAKLQFDTEQVLEEVDAAFAAIGPRIRQGIADSLHEAILQGFDIQGDTGIGAVISTFGNTLLAAFGSIMVDLGEALIQFGLVMEGLTPFLSNPFSSGPAALIAGAALVALGSAFEGIAKRSMPGSARSRANQQEFAGQIGNSVTTTRIPSGGPELSSVTSSPVATGGVSAAATTKTPQPITFNVFGPDDPKAQDAIIQAISFAQRRGHTLNA